MAGMNDPATLAAAAAAVQFAQRPYAQRFAVPPPGPPVNAVRPNLLATSRGMPIAAGGGVGTASAAPAGGNQGMSQAAPTGVTTDPRELFWNSMPPGTHMEQDTKGGLHAVFAPPPGVAPGQMYRHANLGTTPYMQREMLAAGMYSPQTRVENTLRGLYAQSFANDVAGARTQAEHQQALQNYVTNLGKLMYPQFGGLAAMQQSNQQQQQQGGMPIPADSGANISDPLQTGAVFNLVPQQ